ncbi:Phage protein [Caenorhabditis elegans]|uniref:Phage protein n=1 Tax=Caenorhabditis elegans TaxID=6239 RepID=D0VWP3_CAEEL|nr:Phage protein [Caenorhabditis elegans]CBH29654.1 Phage protein [Caenorhabditis elegans]|eukprot:NP_001256855.1 Uncharacterized protein CELE_C25F9.16 [Caenorhabditis elegans]
MVSFEFNGKRRDFENFEKAQEWGDERVLKIDDECGNKWLLLRNFKTSDRFGQTIAPGILAEIRELDAEKLAIQSFLDIAKDDQ